MITLENICKSYQNQPIFTNFNCTISEGVTTCILGPSGKGKTTLFRMLMELEAPDSGTISGLDRLRKSVVFQEDRLCENLKIHANILLPHIKKESAITLTQIDAALAELELSGHENKLVCELSGGMKRRVAILRALFASYDILFLDEPFKGLDDQTKEKTMDYFKKSTQGKTVLWITHDEGEVDYLKPENLLSL
ncbi:MAG: ATP-binding cassette domain-containing protein [Eubacteriales bacterium]